MSRSPSPTSRPHPWSRASGVPRTPPPAPQAGLPRRHRPSPSSRAQRQGTPPPHRRAQRRGAARAPSAAPAPLGPPPPPCPSPHPHRAVGGAWPSVGDLRGKEGEARTSLERTVPGHRIERTFARQGQRTRRAGATLPPDAATGRVSWLSTGVVLPGRRRRRLRWSERIPRSTTESALGRGPPRAERSRERPEHRHPGAPSSSEQQSRRPRGGPGRKIEA